MISEEGVLVYLYYFKLLLLFLYFSYLNPNFQIGLVFGGKVKLLESVNIFIFRKEKRHEKLLATFSTSNSNLS